jgi:hypothetical protein
MNTRNFYIQYHNADNLQSYPFLEADYKTLISDLFLDNSIRKDSWINTRKKQIEKAMGDFCFLIVGKTENTKNYYLWSFFRMDEWDFHERDAFYEVFGSGFCFNRPILLNKFDEFKNFKHFCGNFGIGFQCINKQPFLKILHSFAKKEMHRHKIIFPPFNKSLPLSEEKGIKQKNSNSIIALLNERMQAVDPQERFTKLSQLLRKDKEIVHALKKVANYRCQFPNCNANIIMKNGENYIEVAHIKPVKEGGKSVIGNLLVLCPNHHKEFDYGNLEIKKQTKKTIAGILNGKKFSINLIN